jgi:CRP-like cAMP-binding protein
MIQLLVMHNSKPQRDKLKTFISNYQKYQITITDYLHGLKLIENGDRFDICVYFVDPANPKYRDKIYNTLTQINQNQKIIEVQNEDSQCLFDYSCQECLSRNILTLKEPLKIDNLIDYIDNFDQTICQVLSKNNITSNLNHIHYFRHLNQEQLEKLKTNCIVKKYKPENIVFYTNEEIKYFYFLLTGSVKQFYVQNDGNSIILNKIIVPSFICEAESYGKGYFTSNLESISDCSILCIEKNFFIDMIKHDYKLSLLMFDSLSSQLLEMQTKAINNALTKAHFKIALRIYEKPCILHSITKKDFADELNMAQETLSRGLTKLKSMNILNLKDEIVDFGKLEEFIFSFTDI